MFHRSVSHSDAQAQEGTTAERDSFTELLCNSMGKENKTVIYHKVHSEVQPFSVMLVLDVKHFF